MDDINWDTVTITINGTTLTFWQACAMLGGVCLTVLAAIGTTVVAAVLARRT